MTAGKNIWILGASSGIGRALAMSLSAQTDKHRDKYGDKQAINLILSARSESALHDLNTQLGGQHLVVPCDVGDMQSVMDAITTIQHHYDTIDSVVLLSALYSPTTCDTLNMDEVQKIVQVNVMGAFYVVHAVLPILQQQNYGQLALCASVAGFKGLPNGQPYSATKSAVINLAESLKAENPHLDIKVINPGFVRTALTDKNNFQMPMIISPKQAGDALAKGLQSKDFEIHFPKKFTRIMKFINHLPYGLYFKITKKIKS